VYRIDDTPGLIVTRTVAMLVNIATDAVQQGVASPPDVDTAMRLGTNYPTGPLDWGQRWGADTVLDVLDELESFYRDGHYRACARLRRTATSRRQS
jgi:3-hydroxybutyryl-CoA dehydrogenase